MSLIDQVETVFVEVKKEALAEIKEVVGEVKEFVITEAAKAVSWLKTAALAEPLVTKALNLISLAASTKDTGTAKMLAVVDGIKDMVKEFLAEGGWHGLLENFLGIAKAFAQELFNDLKTGLFPKLGINLG